MVQNVLNKLKAANKSVKLVCAQSSAHLDEQKAARHLPKRYIAET